MLREELKGPEAPLTTKSPARAGWGGLSQRGMGKRQLYGPPWVSGLSRWKIRGINETPIVYKTERGGGGNLCCWPLWLTLSAFPIRYTRLLSQPLPKNLHPWHQLAQRSFPYWKSIPACGAQRPSRKDFRNLTSTPHHYSDCEKHLLLRRKRLSLGFLICTEKAWAPSFNTLGGHMAYFQSSGILMS